MKESEGDTVFVLGLSRWMVTSYPVMSQYFGGLRVEGAASMEQSE